MEFGAPTLPSPFLVQSPLSTWSTGGASLVVHEILAVLVFATTFLHANRSQEMIRIWVGSFFHAIACEALWLGLDLAWHATATVSRRCLGQGMRCGDVLVMCRSRCRFPTPH